MNFLKTIIVCLIILGQQISASQGSQNTVNQAVKDLGQHPIAASLIAAAIVYGLSYGWTQVASYNKEINVDLVDAGTSKIEDATSEENYLFAHGIAETHEQAYWYTKGKSSLPYLIDGRLFTYDYPDATQRFWRVNFPQTGMGQHNEIMGLKSAYDQTIAKLDTQNNQNKDVVLLGMSRGATTILNFMGQQKPEKVKAIIVESPFDSTQALTNNILNKFYLDKIPGMQTIGHYLMSAVFWQHSTNGARAIDSVGTIDQDIPILFVCSEQDKLVPQKSTIALYKKLKDSGHKKVHIFIADSGLHGRILHNTDGLQYQNVVQAFYRKYGLSHDASLADLGESLLDESQLNDEL